VRESVAVAVWLWESVTVAANVADPVLNGVPVTWPVGVRTRLTVARLVVPAVFVLQV
jgi:hypothetical protein